MGVNIPFQKSKQSGLFGEIKLGLFLDWHDINAAKKGLRKRQIGVDSGVSHELIIHKH